MSYCTVEDSIDHGVDVFDCFPTLSHCEVRNNSSADSGGGLQVELESLLGRPVDVVTVRGLKARIRSTVLREAVLV